MYASHFVTYLPTGFKYKFNLHYNSLFDYDYYSIFLLLPGLLTGFSGVPFFAALVFPFAGTDAGALDSFF
jgi:hypothetical protein